MSSVKSRTHVVVLGGNFAGLACAQYIRDYCGESVDITLIDRRDALIFIPNILTDVFENRDPAESQLMPLRATLKKDRIDFIQGDISEIDVDQHLVHFKPSERSGGESRRLWYDFLVIALGAQLAYDRIEGFAEYGHTVSDLFHGQRLRNYLNDGYRGGPIVIGSALFHQGDGAEGLVPYPGGSIPVTKAACEGPPLEITMTMAGWLREHNRGTPDLVTVFTPGDIIAEDAGLSNAKKYLELAGGLGIRYRNNVCDINRLTAEGIEFANGESAEAELKIIMPDWRAHDFLRGLPISDSEGFIITNLLMRNPQYPNVFAAGDCAAVTVPKLGSTGHKEAEIVGRQIAMDVGVLDPVKANSPLRPEIFCIGDIEAGKAFYIHSNTWFGGDVEVMTIGRVPYQLKMRYRDLFFLRHGRVPESGVNLAKFIAENFHL